MSIEEIERWLHSQENAEKAQFRKQKFNIDAEGVMGIDNAQLKAFAKFLPKDPGLGRRLFEHPIYESRLLVSKFFPPKDLLFEDADKWSDTFENWEITDAFSMNVFARSPIALEIIQAFHLCESEFKRRSAFATIAAYCSKRNKDANEVYLEFLPYISAAVDDDRIYVKKALSWALRSIGKRNAPLHLAAIQFAEELASQGSKSALWISRDVLQELSRKSF
jgi:3-methyladenine DNA glycosylase AlkD